jgi:hypothetical protein
MYTQTIAEKQPPITLPICDSSGTMLLTLAPDPEFNTS